MWRWAAFWLIVVMMITLWVAAIYFVWWEPTSLTKLLHGRI
jgi:hypothetical protein